VLLVEYVAPLVVLSELTEVVDKLLGDVVLVE
jgi:hypothetical protein